MSEAPLRSIKPYGVAISDAIVSGDLAKMKEVATAAEQHLSEHGDVASILHLLKVEIAKAEAGS
ncbi:MAG: DUF1843 domain-containing protein [Alphaproteobacteria bacterium]